MANRIPFRTAPLARVPRAAWQPNPTPSPSQLGDYGAIAVAMAESARQIARRNPWSLRSLLPGAVGGVAVQLGLSALGWAFEWLLDELVPPLLYSSSPSPGGLGVGWNLTVEFLSFFTNPSFGVPVQRSWVFQPAPNNPSPYSQLLAGPFYSATPPPGESFWGIYVRLAQWQGPADVVGISDWFNGSLYRFLRIVNFSVTGGIPPSTPFAFDPQSPGVLAPPVPIPLTLPLEIPFPDPSSPVLIPGNVRLRTPVTEGEDQEEVNIDWTPVPNPLMPGIPGFRLSLDADGVTFTQIAPDGAPIGTDTLTAIADTIRDASPPCPDPCPEIDYERIEDSIEEKLTEWFPPARPVQQRSVSAEFAEGTLFDLPPYTQWVRVEILDYPQNLRSQWGGGGPDIYYIGSVAFSGPGGVGGDRQPLHYLDASFPAPEGATAIAILVGTGVTARVTAYYIEGSS